MKQSEKKQMEIRSLFYEYLNSLGLFRIKIWNDHTSVYALVTKEPKKEDFTQVFLKEKTGGLWEVRLSFMDFKNDSITKGFFN